MTEETPENVAEKAEETAQKTVEETVDEKPITEETKEEAKEQAHKEESDSTKLAIQQQSSQFRYLEQLDNALTEEGDANVTDFDFDNALNCKAHVLLELVALADYTTKLSADNPNQKAAEVLTNHLYKCYDKAERIREKIASRRNYLKGRKQRDEFVYSQLYQNMKDAPSDVNSLFAAFGVVFDRDINPDNKVINLTGSSLSGGSLDMVKQLIKHPSESIKAQLPDLISEYTSKVTGIDKEKVDGFFDVLLKGLTALKNPKSMNAALEGINAVTNLLSLNANTK